MSNLTSMSKKDTAPKSGEDEKVNCSLQLHSSVHKYRCPVMQSQAYTSLLAMGPNSALVLYNRYEIDAATSRATTSAGFSMRIEFK